VPPDVWEHTPPPIEDGQKFCRKRFDRVDDRAALHGAGTRQEGLHRSRSVDGDVPRAGRPAMHERSTAPLVCLAETHIRFELGRTPEQVGEDEDR